MKPDCVSPDPPRGCPKCGCPDLILTWQRFANGTRHVRKTCGLCAKFLGYVSQSPEAVQAADAAEEAAEVAELDWFRWLREQKGLDS